MKIVALSDLHGSLPPLPECDVVVISGDIVPLEVERDGEESAAWLSTSFQRWCLDSPCKRVIFIGGNHDRLLEHLLGEYTIDEIVNGLFAEDCNHKIVLLHDSAYTFEGITFYGTPWCPDLIKWAFYGDDDLRRTKYQAIPDCDVLLTHCPPKIGTQGVVLGKCRVSGTDFGDPILAETLATKHIRWVISGHIHSGNHAVEMIGKTKCRNCSIKDEQYNVGYAPFEFEI